MCKVNAAHFDIYNFLLAILLSLLQIPSRTLANINTNTDGKVCISEIPAAVVIALTLFLATECLLICTATICKHFILYSSVLGKPLLVLL